jgi:tetratricopeptide (TPR) repeat protein
MSDATLAEQLWLKAHAEVKTGNLAQSVRDLAKCYELLKVLKDPRLAQVHRRWVEVHKLYQQRKARAQAAHHAQLAQAQAAQAQAAQAQAVQAQAVLAQVAQAEAPAQVAAQPVQAQAAPGQVSWAQAAPAQQPQPSASDEPVRVEPRVSQAEPRTLGEQAEAAANAGNLEQAVAIYKRLLAASPSNDFARERLWQLTAARSRADAMGGPAADSSGLAQDDVAFLEGLLQKVQERRRVA